MFSIGWNTEHVTTALICSKCVGLRRVKFCVGNFSFATVKFLSKISFMMVELIKCLVKWTISSGDSIFFTDATLVNINSLKFHQNSDNIQLSEEIFYGNFEKFSILNIPFALVA